MQEGKGLCHFFVVFCESGYRGLVSKRNSYTATRNVDLSSRVGWPGFWVHRSQHLAWQPPFSNSRLPLTSVDCFLLLTAREPCLSSSSSGLIGDLAQEPFVWFPAKTNKGILCQVLTRIHNHRTNVHTVNILIEGWKYDRAE